MADRPRSLAEARASAHLAIFMTNHRARPVYRHTMPPEQPRRVNRPDRPAWVVAEYERIGREREHASREADRVYRRELLRVCLEIFVWTIAGCALAAFAFHVRDRDTGLIFLYAGMLVNISGVFTSCLLAYHRGQERGDW